MMKKSYRASILALATVVFGIASCSSLASGQDTVAVNGRLAVIWSSGDPDVAHKVCFMYTHNAKRQKWFDEVLLIVWGPSAKLLAEDEGLQAKVKAMLDDGIKVQACQACSDSYGISDRLRKIGVDVKYMGVPLTNILKQNWKVLTF